MQGKGLDVMDSPYISGSNPYPQYTSMSVQSGSTNSNPSPNQRVHGAIPTYGKSKMVAGAKISGASQLLNQRQGTGNAAPMNAYNNNHLTDQLIIMTDSTSVSSSQQYNS